MGVGIPPFISFADPQLILTLCRPQMPTQPEKLQAARRAALSQGAGVGFEVGGGLLVTTSPRPPRRDPV